VKLDPRGLLYVKLSLQEHWSVPSTAPQVLHSTTAVLRHSTTTWYHGTVSCNVKTCLAAGGRRESVWSGTTPSGGQRENCSSHSCCHPENSDGNREERDTGTCFPTCLPVCLSVCLSVCLTVYLFVSVSGGWICTNDLCLSTCLSDCVPVFLTDCEPVCHLSTHLSVYLSV